MENPKKSIFPLNLLKGEISLWKTYWLFGVVGNICASFLIGFSMTMGNAIFILTIMSIFVMYLIIVYIGIWNSASRYKGSKIWAILAKVMVFLGVISFFAQFNQ